MTAAAADRCGHCGGALLPLDHVHYPARRGEADAGNPLLGSVIEGKFRLEGVLGRGGLGTVFQAEHIGSLMKVALKLLHPRFSERVEYRRALLDEARLAATVIHERCARLLDVGETSDGGTWLAMELVEGVTLDEIVRDGPLKPSHAVELLAQIAEALVAIHAVGLVHCDLSPRNVMVTTRGGSLSVKVLDFGIARPTSMSADLGGGFSGFGNPAFSAPEHLAGHEVGHRADLYSLGALGRLMLGGRAPTDEKQTEWPGVPGAPRRLVRLIRRCLARDPADRPSSASAVLRELRLVQGGRRPVLQRSALALLLISALAVSPAFFRSAPPFLDPVAGSPLRLSDSPPETPVVMPSRDLSEVQFHFGGFRARSLRFGIARAGTLLLERELRPEVDPDGGTLTLATAQPEWRSVVESLVDSSREGAVDVSFVVPGHAPLGSMRIRLDDEPPTLLGEPVVADSPADVLQSSFVFEYEVSDAVGLREAVAIARFADGEEERFALPADRLRGNGVFPLGRALADRRSGTAASGPVAVSLSASDWAGNASLVEIGRFARCDLRAPEVVSVTGPAGEPFLPSLEGRVRLRIELDEAEAGCRIHVSDREGRPYLQAQIDSPGRFHVFEISSASDGEAFGTGSYVFLVTDAAGNRSRRELPCTVRNRSTRLEPLRAGGGAAFDRGELVLPTAGGHATIRHAADFEIARATILGEGTRRPVETEAAGDEVTGLRIGPLRPGAYTLELELADASGIPGGGAREVMPVRVLPDRVVLRVAHSASRFLPGLEAGGVLTRAERGYRDGAGWAIPGGLRPYVRGEVVIAFGDRAVVRRSLLGAAGPEDPLLPEIDLLPGHTVLGVRLVDVLSRPVEVLVDDSPAPRRELRGTEVAVLADFWWSDQPPIPIGEEFLVEYGRPARLRLRLPVPYRREEASLLQLDVGPDVSSPVSVEPDGEGAVVTFEVPFSGWSVAAQIADLPRERYAEQLERPLAARLQTPLGSHRLSLSLRTVRSTLRPVWAGEFAEVPAALSGLRLVPVLAPVEPFADPVPAEAPPRAAFRPQASVEVRGISDFLLQDRELRCGEAVAIVEAGLALAGSRPARDLVHAEDPLGEGRLSSTALLPPKVRVAPTGRPLTGVDFYQAHTLCRLLGLVVHGDPNLFRLPTGTELEVAAFGDDAGKACNAAAARGHPVAMAAFVEAAARLRRGRPADAATDRAAGDVAPSPFGVAIIGLDFGVREWVVDLPHIEGEELLLGEWNAHHGAFLARVAAFAEGSLDPPPRLAAALRRHGVVRGLALGEVSGLIDRSGRPLDVSARAEVPACVPGVLRTEQLRRDGRDPLSAGRDPRLRVIGFRVAGTDALVALLRGLE